MNVWLLCRPPRTFLLRVCPASTQPFGCHLPVAETEEYDKTDFTVFVNPNLQMAETTPESGIEATQNMRRIVYEESGSVMPTTSLVPFMAVLGSLVRAYGVTGVWRELYVYSDYEGAERSSEEVLGDQQGARLEYSFAWHPYDASTDRISLKALRGFQLVHSQTGEQFDLSIEIELLHKNTTAQLKLRFEGDAGEIEKFKEAVKPMLEDCWRNMTNHT